MSQRTLRIAFLADYFASWTGGAMLLSHVLNSVIAAAEGQHAEVEVLVDARGLPEPLRAQAAPGLRVEVERLGLGGGLATLVESSPITHLTFYSDLPAVCRALAIDVIGPSGADLGADFPLPWFGYLPDFQHQYLHGFFSQAERAARDRHFRAVVENAAGVFVNSETVGADVERFMPGAAQRTRILRLPPLWPALRFDATPDAAAARHGLTRPFFMSCSQRWLHKQHPLIVEAFADFVARNPHLPVDLVFTGDTGDHRDPRHAREFDDTVARLGVADRVRSLGMVPRGEQIALIRLAIAVVQASRFEGGPGASGTLEAALLGVPVIASDIRPNRELPFGRARFFDARSAQALSDEMGRQVALLAATPAGAEGPRPPFDPDTAELMSLASGAGLIATLRSAA